MSDDLISRSTLAKEIENIEIPFGNDNESYISMPRVLDIISEQPTIDAVKVVRCNDCVNHRHCITEDAFKIVWIEDGFCKVGKLKGANNE